MGAIDFDIVREMMRSRRERRGLTFEDIGNATGVPRNTVANFLMGLTKRPKVKALHAYLIWLEMPAERFKASKEPTLNKVEAALSDDPLLTSEGARELSQLVRAAYQAVTHKSGDARNR